MRNLLFEFLGPFSLFCLLIFFFFTLVVRQSHLKDIVIRISKNEYTEEDKLNDEQFIRILTVLCLIFFVLIIVDMVLIRVLL